jgi:hypothetical protein
MTDDMLAKRSFVMNLYPGPKWKKQVQNMPDRQVIAIYLREMNKPPKQDKPKESGNDDIPF